MRASQASIVFPALILHENDDLYEELRSAEDLFIQMQPSADWILNGEIVDSAGQRFLIRALVDAQRIESSPSGWRRWMEVLRNSRRYRCDFELEPLPLEAFEDTFRRLLEKEAGQEAYHIMEGGSPDPRETKERFSQCRSIADIIAYHDPPRPLPSPPAKR